MTQNLINLIVPVPGHLGNNNSFSIPRSSLDMYSKRDPRSPYGSPLPIPPNAARSDYKASQQPSLLFTPQASDKINMLEETAVQAEHNRTVSLLNHISDLRQLLKQQIDKSQTLTSSQQAIEHSLRQVGSFWSLCLEGFVCRLFVVSL